MDQLQTTIYNLTDSTKLYEIKDLCTATLNSQPSLMNQKVSQEYF